MSAVRNKKHCSKSNMVISMSGSELLEVIEKSENQSAMTPKETEALRSIKNDLARHGKRFNWDESIVSKLRNIVYSVCWDVV